MVASMRYEFCTVPNSDVIVLLGFDVPGVHWPLEQRISDGKEPYAVIMFRGLMMYDPLGETEHTASVFINMYSSEYSIGEQLRMLYDQEFADSSGSSATPSSEDKFTLQLVNDCTRFVSDHNTSSAK